jgi:hypothetical protein
MSPPDGSKAIGEQAPAEARPAPEEYSGPLKVSLDQNFLWNFHTRENAGACRLHAALGEKVARGQVICPLHFQETIFESAMLREELRNGIFAIGNALSGGWAFRFFGERIARETLGLVRPDQNRPTLVRGPLRIRPGTDFEAMGRLHRMAKGEYQQRLDQTPYPPASYRPEMSIDDIHRAIRLERAASMWRLLKAIRRDQNLETGKPEWECTVGIAQFLLQHDISSEECETLIGAVRCHRWEGQPTLLAHSRLCAQLELGYLKAGRRSRPNDTLDIYRLAVAVNEADIICCDHPMAELIRQTKLRDSRLQTVFSLKTAEDAAALIEAL